MGRSAAGRIRGPLMPMRVTVVMIGRMRVMPVSVLTMRVYMGFAKATFRTACGVGAFLTRMKRRSNQQHPRCDRSE